ncbi:MAG: hypothetical protein WBE72_15865 [Terracidiphilus sp.]
MRHPSIAVVGAMVIMLLVGAERMGAKQKKPKGQNATPYPECALRDSSVSESECEARLNLTEDWVQLPECTNLYGEDYRLCAVKVPSKWSGQSASTRPTHLPTPNEAALKVQRDAASVGRLASGAEITKAYNDALSAEKQAIDAGKGNLVAPEEVQQITQEKNAAALAQATAKERVGCPSHAEIGEQESEVYRCQGYPDHVNDEPHGLRQLVYPDDVFIYIDTDTGRVENVQWSH